MASITSTPSCLSSTPNCSSTRDVQIGGLKRCQAMPSRKVKIFTVPGADHPLTIERNAFRAFPCLARHCSIDGFTGPGSSGFVDGINKINKKREPVLDRADRFKRLFK